MCSLCTSPIPSTANELSTKLVLQVEDQEGGEDSAGEEVRPCRACGDMPQPRFSEHDLKPFLDLQEDGPALPRIGGWLPLDDRDQGRGGEEEGGGVEDHGERRLEQLDDRTRERRASGVGDRVARLQLAVRVDQLVALHERWKVCLVGDIE